MDAKPWRKPVEAKAAFERVLREVKKHIAGKTDLIELMFIALVANGHCILEGVPGVAKTQVTKTLADAVDAVPQSTGNS